MEKYEKLKMILGTLERVLVAYSGGVDSCLLSYTARQVLGEENVLAVTADSETFTREELSFARDFCGEYRIPLRVITTPTLAEINRNGNPRDRCYFCKKNMLSRLLEIAREEGYVVVEGSNQDDRKDFRPGSKAVGELPVVSPLKEAGLTKSEIRELSKAAGLPSWDRPAYACLASRFPYHMKITEEDLRRVEAAEKFLHESGFPQCRVRSYGTWARIEVEVRQIEDAFRRQPQIDERMRELGYTEIEIDPEGYRMGNMNPGSF